jgi:ATP-dependent RNA/DNA helicase IGHMBP2
VVELIKQAVHYKQWKVLLCAPSNVAVDNVLERLVAYPTSKKSSRKTQCLRLGHPARLAPSVLEHSMERLIRSADGSDVLRDCKQELQQYINVMNESYNAAKDRYQNKGKAKKSSSGGVSGASRSKAANLSYSERRQMKSEMKHLRKEIRTREEKVLRELIESRHVILATNVGAANRVLNDVSFDLVVIDEAAQALEASCWIPALRGNRLVLAGDHKQLAPTIQSRLAGSRGLGYTMFDRAMAIHGTQTISRMLSVQYRMHETISDWASQAMYDGKLRSAPSVAHRKLADLPNVKAACLDGDSETEMDEDITDVNLLLIDTAGCDMEEETSAAGSKRNPGEARIVQQHGETSAVICHPPSEPFLVLLSTTLYFLSPIQTQQ